MRRNYSNITPERAMCCGAIFGLISLTATIIVLTTKYAILAIYPGLFTITFAILFFVGLSKRETISEEEKIETKITTTSTYNQSFQHRHFDTQNKITILYKYRKEPIMRSEIIKMCYENIDFYEKNRKLIGYSTPCLAYYRLVNLYSETKQKDKIIEICEKAVQNNQNYPKKDYFKNKLRILKEVKK